MTILALGNVAFPITVGMAIYLVVHLLLRSPELQALRRRRQKPKEPQEPPAT